MNSVFFSKKPLIYRPLSAIITYEHWSFSGAYLIFGTKLQPKWREQ